MKTQTVTEKLDIIKSNTKKSILIDQLCDLMNELIDLGVEDDAEQKINSAMSEIELEQKWVDNESKKLSLEIIKEK